MPISLRFVVPLALALAAIAYAIVPVVEDGRLVGVLSRAVIRRRLAEDAPPAEPELA